MLSKWTLLMLINESEQKYTHSIAFSKKITKKT